MSGIQMNRDTGTVFEILLEKAPISPLGQGVPHRHRHHLGFTLRPTFDNPQWKRGLKQKFLQLSIQIAADIALRYFVVVHLDKSAGADLSLARLQTLVVLRDAGIRNQSERSRACRQDLSIRSDEVLPRGILLRGEVAKQRIGPLVIVALRHVRWHARDDQLQHVPLTAVRQDSCASHVESALHERDRALVRARSVRMDQRAEGIGKRGRELTLTGVIQREAGPISRTSCVEYKILSSKLSQVLRCEVREELFDRICHRRQFFSRLFPAWIDAERFAVSQEKRIDCIRVLLDERCRGGALLSEDRSGVVAYVPHVLPALRRHEQLVLV